MSTLFSNLNLSSPLLKALTEAGYTTPTPVQAQAIPLALAGHDVVASAQTGTGKTAAFVLPALQKLQEKRQTQGIGPRVLVLTPTRELALQVLDAVKKYSKYHRVFSGAIIGGTKYFEQNKMLSRQVDFIVGTPGRITDLIERGRLDLSAVEVLVLDEADRMLDMGFRDAVENIAGLCPPTRQTLMFTATLDDSMRKLAARLLKEPQRVDIAGTQRAQVNIDQRLLWSDDLSHKFRLLDHLLANTGFFKGIIFTSTKRDADRLADELKEKGHSVAALHGDMHQRQRNRTVTNLRNAKIHMIVATDVAARGIDISDLTHVINFDLPRTAEDYVHRIGRTGRAGATGTAWSLASRGDRGLIKAIEKYISKSLTEEIIPGLEPKPQAPANDRAPRHKKFHKKGHVRPSSPAASHQRSFRSKDSEGQSERPFKKKSFSGTASTQPKSPNSFRQRRQQASRTKPAYGIKKAS